jgi:mono/diheme cytochrome c family protein
MTRWRGSPTVAAMGRRAALVLAITAALAVPVLAAARNGQSPPTWTQDVAPILLGKCAGCHTAGGIAPFALTSARDARIHARQIDAVVARGQMPPWMPGPDSPAYVGQSRRILTQAEKETIAAWVDGGARTGIGRAPRRPAAPKASRSRTVTLRPAHAYAPRAGATDDYRCFLLDPKLARDSWVTGARIVPDRAAQVHHVILFEAAGAQAKDAQRLNAASGGRGWTCYGGPGVSLDLSSPNASLRFGSPQWLAAWVPGSTKDALPAGRGIQLRAGARIVMQVHYNLLNGAKPDRSKAVLRFAARAKPLETMLLAAPVELACGAGSSGTLCTREAALEHLRRDYGSSFLPDALLAFCGRAGVTATTTACTRRVGQPLTVYGVAGHMHVRGRDIRVIVDPGTPAERTLLHIPAWNFHWQDAYELREPVRVEAGHTLGVRCRFENATDRYVLWGEGTADEMCLGVLQVALG